MYVLTEINPVPAIRADAGRRSPFPDDPTVAWFSRVWCKVAYG